ncbi:MAG TPA: hypothetical protein VFV23_06145 [Verrucomicrobiae bacterium]|nr:hypothetical protein [Verrucomicrobiae bacterium]
MHWLWAGQWHWIHTFDSRMNVSACGMEWLSAPLILFTHTDRLLFLINWISYLMLPGLIFSVFTRLQVRLRVAWWWMWLLSSGWCFVLQASSIANDSFAAIYILAAVDLALRAREKNSVGDLWLSYLAAALVTGTKQTNIPLVALWAVAACPARSLFLKRPLSSLGVAVIGVLVSIVPVCVFNYQHYGTWMPLDSSGIGKLGQFKLNPFWGVIGNLFCIPVQNLVPPFYELIPPFYSYWASIWNETMQHFLQTSFGSHFRSFENFGHLSASYYHGISEGDAGLGLGICLLIFAAVWKMRKLRTSAVAAVRRNKFLFVLRILPWALLLVFIAKVGAFENARHLAPYYVFLFPAFLVQPAQSWIVRHRQWQKLGFITMGVTIALIIGSGNRPLFPAKTIFASLYQTFPKNEFVLSEYEKYVNDSFRINEARRSYLEKILPEESNIGYFALMYDVDEPGIWLPYGHRSVLCVTPKDSPDFLRSHGVNFVVMDGRVLSQRNIDRWLDRFNATLIGRYIFPHPEVRNPTPDVYLIRLN